MANYIQKLEDDLSVMRKRHAALKDGLNDLEIYLFSPKFSQDTTVQAMDVMRRVRETLTAETDAGFEQCRINALVREGHS